MNRYNLICSQEWRNGRRVRFRSVWQQYCVGSSPISCMVTKKGRHVVYSFFVRSRAFLELRVQGLRSASVGAKQTSPGRLAPNLLQQRLRFYCLVRREKGSPELFPGPSHPISCNCVQGFLINNIKQTIERSNTFRNFMNVISLFYDCGILKKKGVRDVLYRKYILKE